MSGSCSSHPILRTGVRVLFAFALAVATQLTNAATAEDAPGSSSASYKLVKFSEYGSVRVVPNSDSPQGCLKRAKGACSGKFAGTMTSTLFPGVSQNRGTFTLDFTKPEASAIGVCFPELVSGTVHTSRGDFKLVEQGPLCIPPASAKLPPGFEVQLRPGLLTGGTGAFAHLFAAYSVCVSANPSGLIIFRHDGVASGLEGGGE
jgi:hypothetical protein